MKKTIFAALALLASTTLMAQKAVITGKLNGLKPESHVFLMDIANPNDLKPVEVTADGTYKLELDAPEPYARFLIVDDPKGGFKFYVEQGMKANIDAEFVPHNEGGEEYYESKVTYTGDCKDCYEFLSEGEFYQYAQNPVLMTYYQKQEPTFGEFRQLFRYKVDQLEGKLMKIQNPTFRRWMKQDYEKKMNAAMIWYTELSSKPDSTFDAWAETLDRNDNQQDAQMYAQAWRFTLPKGAERDVTFFKGLNEKITNQELATAVADQRISELLPTAPANIDELFAAWRAVNPNREVPEAIQQTYDHFKNLVPGAKAADFDMYDANGKKLTLSKLKGKALYIDCWATWCGPCRAETPNMVKLYEHFKNDKRIQLVSISLDKKEAAWKAVVKKENLAWPQYIVKGEFESAMCKNYDIQGIPRFMMFDKRGNIVSIDAPRPSAANIIEWIESNLK